MTRNPNLYIKNFLNCSLLTAKETQIKSIFLILSHYFERFTKILFLIKIFLDEKFNLFHKELPKLLRKRRLSAIFGKMQKISRREIFAKIAEY